MQSNYQPWEIDVNAFPEKGSLRDQLLFLLCFATLAPSGHNSQPWEFSIKDNLIFVSIARARILEESDQEGRQLLISIGCAIENLIVAADYYGFEVEVTYFPDLHNSNLITEIFFKKLRDASLDKNHLIFMIPKRHTNRNKYDDALPSQEFLEKIQKISNNDVQVTILTDKEKKNRAADLALNAQIEVMDSDSFREELSHYIKSSFTKSKVGMPGSTLGIPAPISLIASKLIKKMNLSRKTKKKDEDLLKQFTPVFVVISAIGDDRMNWVKAGQLFEQIWLMATHAGLSCAPLAAPVQVGEYYKQLQLVLGISMRPLVFFRMGHCNKVALHSPRLEAGEAIR